jgi:broad specificity phosphatase PhoE
MTVFLVRHGESVWNEAQGHHNFVKMFKQVDHELNQEGLQQAEGLRLRWSEACAATDDGHEAVRLF